MFVSCAACDSQINSRIFISVLRNKNSVRVGGSASLSAMPKGKELFNRGHSLRSGGEAANRVRGRKSVVLLAP